MRKRQNLRIFGSRQVHRNFLPSDNSIFRTSSFSQVFGQEQANEVLSSLRKDELGVLVDPLDFDFRAIPPSGGSIWLWFLEPIVDVHSADSIGNPRLSAVEAAGLERKVCLLEQTDWSGAVGFIVSDPASQEFMSSKGISTVLSPPPVSDAIQGMSLKSSSDFSFFSGDSWGDLARSYAEARNKVSSSPEIRDISESINWPRSAFSVSFPQTFRTRFPYEAAVALFAGQALIAGSIEPLWGVEPGIDFLEFSSPEELAYILLHLWRWPTSVNLMRYRGLQKARAFKASDVYRELLREL